MLILTVRNPLILKAACPERAQRSRRVEGRDVRVVEGARLEIEAGQPH